VKTLDKLLILLILWLALGGGVPGFVSPAKVDAVTYVYEKDNGSVPPPVLAALNTLNERGIMATVFEEDTTDSDGQVPEQYREVLPAAREAGLPALVASGGGKVVRTIKAPTTTEQVLEAAR
jgi:hypothetical protein